MVSEAIILAGGLGTRLREVVPDLPKCMAPVAGKPFIHYVIGHLIRQGISRFIFSLGYKKEILLPFLMDEERRLVSQPLNRKNLNHATKKIDFRYSVEDTPLGTGGAVLQACQIAEDATILVLNGDTLFDADISALVALHNNKRAECTLALKKMTNSDRYGVVILDEEGRIIGFHEKKWYAESLINGGVYILNKTSFLNAELPGKFSFEADYLQQSYQEKPFFGFVQDKYFIDIGIPSDYNRANEELKSFS